MNEIGRPCTLLITMLVRGDNVNWEVCPYLKYFEPKNIWATPPAETYD